jgi:hypothetical protein
MGIRKGNTQLSLPKIPCRWDFKMKRGKSGHGIGKEKYSAYQQDKKRDSSVDGRRGDGNPERKYSVDQRYHAGGISRWTGDRVVTGQGKKIAQLSNSGRG